jgi:hypothetical protein
MPHPLENRQEGYLQGDAKVGIGVGGAPQAKAAVGYWRHLDAVPRPLHLPVQHRHRHLDHCDTGKHEKYAGFLIWAVISGIRATVGYGLGFLRVI